MDKSLAVNILVAVVALAGALGATFLNNVFQGRRETKAEKRKSRDLYLQDVESFIVGTAELRTFLSTRTAEEIQELPRGANAMLPPEYRKMAALADTAFVALGAPANVRQQIIRMMKLITNMITEHRSPGEISQETGTAIIDGMADIRKAVLAVKDHYLDNPTPS